jgi:hypothetical protein
MSWEWQDDGNNDGDNKGISKMLLRTWGGVKGVRGQQAYVKKHVKQ